MTDRLHIESLDFVEDFSEENGCYQNNCIRCRQTFLGHKYRRICKICHGTNTKSEMTTDERVAELRKVTDNFIFIEYYTHTSCDMWKILNEYTNFKSDKLVLCSLSDGIDKALDLAIEAIKLRKLNYEK